MPYIGSCGALDMVNFGPVASVPERYRGRKLHVHNPTVTLMRTTPEENAQIGRWIGERLNMMGGPVRFFLPEGGLSALDATAASRSWIRMPMKRCSERSKRPSDKPHRAA